MVASAVAQSPAVRAEFDSIVFLPFGQEPVPRDLMQTMHRQLTSTLLAPEIATDDEALDALREAAAGKRVLCVLDDVWSDVWSMFASTLDLVSGGTKLLVTTRLKGLVPGAAEYELGLLSPDDSVALMLECAGETVEAAAGAHTELAYKAAELCGYVRTNALDFHSSSFFSFASELAHTPPSHLPAASRAEHGWRRSGEPRRRR